MLGIVWDVNKIITNLQAQFVGQVDYLQHLVEKQEQRLNYLEGLLFKKAGLIKEEPVMMYEDVVVSAPLRIRNWKDQKSLLEKKFRPPELVEREKHWSEVANVAEQEVMKDAR